MSPLPHAAENTEEFLPVVVDVCDQSRNIFWFIDEQYAVLQQVQ